VLAGILIALLGLAAACVAIVIAQRLVGPVEAPPRPRAENDLENEIETLRLMVLQLRLELTQAERSSVSRDLELRRDIGSARRNPVGDERSLVLAQAPLAGTG
jgi:hypothetical protein